MRAEFKSHFDTVTATFVAHRGEWLIQNLRGELRWVSDAAFRRDFGPANRVAPSVLTAARPGAVES